MPIKADKSLRAYYNEIDPFAAQWIRNLMAEGWITKGDVDERSIEDVLPNELAGYDRLHFFAGVAVWDYALNQAGWGRSEIWTGSCPCQPFSAAGKGSGFDDERHLWPHFHWLISQCRPAVVLGEQVASKDGLAWLDLVQADLEGAGYTSGAVDTCAAGFGAPHIRQRLYWVAYADSTGSLPGAHARVHRAEKSDGARHGEPKRYGAIGRLADTTNVGLDGRGTSQTSDGRDAARIEPERLCDAGRLEHASSRRRDRREAPAPGHIDDGQASERAQSEHGLGIASAHRIHQHAAGPTNGHWRNADWLLCRDGKWRPVEPGYEQMADGSARSLGRVRACAVEEIEGQIDEWSIRYQTDGGEGLRRVWRDLQSQALCEWEIGRFSGVQSPAVLLAFLRQLAEQGWRFSDALACARTEASQIVVRILRFDSGAARTPLRRELAEQLSEQPADPMQELSSILAHHAAQCWGEACRTKAGAASFPLAHNAPARVVRLRGYGNAINAQQATAFIEAVMGTNV